MEELKKYLIILAVIVGLIALLVTFTFEGYELVVVLVVVVFIGFLYLPLLKKQRVGTKEYYETILKKEKEHGCFDYTLLSKMFEMRITNRRKSIFVHLLLLSSFFLAIIAISGDICQYSNVLLFVVCDSIITGCAVVAVLGILFLLYLVAEFDKYAIEKLDELLKAMEKLHQFKKESDEESAKSIEKSRMQD